jgi:hypothetical protein
MCASSLRLSSLSFMPLFAMHCEAAFAMLDRAKLVCDGFCKIPLLVLAPASTTYGTRLRICSQRPMIECRRSSVSWQLHQDNSFNNIDISIALPYKWQSSGTTSTML